MLFPSWTPGTATCDPLRSMLFKTPSNPWTSNRRTARPPRTRTANRNTPLPSSNEPFRIRALAISSTHSRIAQGLPWNCMRGPVLLQIASAISAHTGSSGGGRSGLSSHIPTFDSVRPICDLHPNSSASSHLMRVSSRFMSVAPGVLVFGPIMSVHAFSHFRSCGITSPNTSRTSPPWRDNR